MKVKKFDDILNFEKLETNSTSNISVEAKDDEDRPPIDMNITSVDPSGLMTIMYSEKLWSLT